MRNKSLGWIISWSWSFKVIYRKITETYINGIRIFIHRTYLAAYATKENKLLLVRAVSYRNGINEQLYLQLTDQKEYITITGKSKDNTIIISLHGGPGAPTTYIDYCWQDYLTDDFTIVCWDERGSGRSYGSMLGSRGQT